MGEYNRSSHERLLQEWQIRRETINFYSRTLQHLSPDDPNAAQRWRELSSKLAIAQLALVHASDQLQSADQERTGANPAQQ